MYKNNSSCFIFGCKHLYLFQDHSLIMLHKKYYLSKIRFLFIPCIPVMGTKTPTRIPSREVMNKQAITGWKSLGESQRRRTAPRKDICCKMPVIVTGGVYVWRLVDGKNTW